MSNSDPDLVEHLKSLEGNNYISETALFDILNEIGVVLPKGYRSGSRNKELARKEVNRYIEYKSLHEIDPNYKKKRAVTITKVRDLPIPKEDGRGSSGRYADYLRPLIVKTAIDYPFRGTKTELFDSWGVYNNYREEQIRNGLFNPNIGRSFNPWSIKKDMQPGETKYCQIISFKERNSLETALDSLSKEGVIEWSKYTRYMEEHMDKEKLYYPQGYTEDHMGIFNTNETSRTFLLKSSKTAVQLHENLKRLFYIAF